LNGSNVDSIDMYIWYHFV